LIRDDRTEVYPEKMEANPAEMKYVAEHQEATKEEVTLEISEYWRKE
jgi:hypothetical protein